jgi:hypothetical protein
MTGVDAAGPGIGAFHNNPSAGEVFSGSPVSSHDPSKCGPRQFGQSPACVKEASARRGRIFRAVMIWREGAGCSVFSIQYSEVFRARCSVLGCQLEAENLKSRVLNHKS